MEMSFWFPLLVDQLMNGFRSNLSTLGNVHWPHLVLAVQGLAGELLKTSSEFVHHRDSFLVRLSAIESYRPCCHLHSLYHSCGASLFLSDLSIHRTYDFCPQLTRAMHLKTINTDRRSIR